MIKKRYLQLSDVIMFEYNLLGQDDDTDILNPSTMIVANLKDGHDVVFSAIDEEVEPDNDSSTYKKQFDPKSLNTLNHLAVPKDSTDSMWYTFIDPNYQYVQENILTTIDEDAVKPSQYVKYLNYTDEHETSHFSYYQYLKKLRWDNMKLYFVNGYDFSNIYGFLVRISVDNNDGGTVDLCDFFFNSSVAFNVIKYLADPIIFGNNVYDRYIELNLPCLYDLTHDTSTNVPNADTINRTYVELIERLNISPSTNVKLNFAYVLSEDKELENIPATSIFSQPINNVNCTFTKSSSLRGVVPTDTINSDNLGCYVASYPDVNYIEFYGTWRDKPLTYSIVDRFNKGIILYDNSLIKRDSTYEVEDDYSPEYNTRKWVAMHELKCSFCMGDQVLKEETYNMSQIFVSDADPYKFYYKPIIFDDTVGLYIDNINIVYTMRFVNVDDKVQFVKVASLAITGDTAKFYVRGNKLGSGSMTPFKIFNKIVDNKHENVAGTSGISSTKYVKVFYDSTSIVLDDNGQAQNGNYNYTLQLSQAPKVYKFTFKNMASDGKYTYMDLTNGYYKLMFKDSAGKIVTIDPTYSTNMNLYFGEIEFSLTTDILSKLQEVEPVDRKMSIVAYSDNNLTSSMFDFLYSI